MYASERSQPPRGQALPSLKSIFSSESTQDFPSPYTPRTHHQSPPLPPFHSRGSPREHGPPPPPSVHGPSPYYPNYQNPPAPTMSQAREGPEVPPYPSPMSSTNQTAPPPLPPHREPMYSLSSGLPPSRQPLDHGKVPPPPRQPEQERSPQHAIANHRRLSAAPSQSGLPESYHTPTSSFGSTPRTPRVIDERYVAGEGLCYVYEDGSRVQKYIDGENVNPQWGVTKAGKPRKRLAQACTTCREKKIKCDPSSPKCIQCQKFGRECRFENAPRGHHHLSSNFTPNMARPNVYEQQQDGSAPNYYSERNYAHMSSPGGPVKRSAHEALQTSPYGDRAGTSSQQGNGIKRQRRGSASSSTPESQQESKDFKGKSTLFGRPSDASEIDNTNVNGLKWHAAAEWRADPFELDPESANYHLNLYFDHINSATYCMFPKKPFMKWCHTKRDKSPDDRMLIYCLLSMGAVFSDKPDRTATLKRLMSAADHALQNSWGKFSLQLVQSRLMLGFVHFSLGNSTKSWDYCGTAVRAACGLRLNTEDGVSDVNSEQELEYGFNKAAMEECHRRTFWSAFIMDRFNGFCSGHMSMINIDDCYLRLPMHESNYEEQLPLATPYFRNSLIDPALCNTSSPSNLGSMAHLVQVSAAWGETMAFIYRSSFLPSSAFPRRYEAQHSSIMTRLSDWMSNLPDHLTWSEENLDKSIRQGYIGTFISLHSLYHSTIMKLNRRVRFSTLPRETIIRNVRVTQHHAKALLQAVRRLAKVDRQALLKEQWFAFSIPFTGHAILIATDVLTAGGALVDLPEIIRLVDSGLEVLEELAQFWASAKAQYRHIGERLKLLADTLAEYGTNNNGDATKKIGWSIKEPIDTTFPKADDLVYSLERKEYLKVMGVEIKADEEIVVVDCGPEFCKKRIEREMRYA